MKPLEEIRFTARVVALAPRVSTWALLYNYWMNVHSLQTPKMRILQRVARQELRRRGIKVMTLLPWGDSEQEHKNLREMLDYCTDHIHKCSQWEQDFLESISDQLHNRGTLSPKQREVLTKIYDKL